MSQLDQKLNILVLHSLGDPQASPYFLKHHVFSLAKYQPGHNYLYHDVALSLPEYVKELSFDAIILDVTLLCYRWFPDRLFQKILDDYDFVSQSHAYKIAFPQDEYDCNEVLDEWLCHWGVNLVYSVLATDHSVIYPTYSTMGNIKLGYTGYIDDSLLAYEIKPFESRSIDIGYRARRLPPYFGRLGEVKWTVGKAVHDIAPQYGLKADIALGEESFLLGDSWLSFLNDSKFTLGANSGSSLLDPRGKIRKSIKEHLKKDPDVNFDQLEKLYFEGADGLYAFTAISPRVLEAALVNSCQILVEGEYSGIMDPWVHYIPINSDASNFDEVYTAMNDVGLVQRLIGDCRTAILDVDDLRYNRRAEKIICDIKDGVTHKGVSSPFAKVENVINKYKEEMSPLYEKLWRRKRFVGHLVKTVERWPIVSTPLRAVYNSMWN